ncbi:uncharacterized protein F5891DRAFT_1184354 [Suillus fuscotomentosus]|uniref:Uncharacterized protein n=1 Tax=Suillus fuscotomentosus TaxID=1912939 RepID=A0AAD4EDT6_9AGAM|nr:uncharacterized protein F5891DRAFT_1184354 [Suillus fuscotomentosus]KAG1904172.1 hypothetical protein F5891DRAFT_1184354 [Suillus fuscotomentosus]
MKDNLDATFVSEETTSKTNDNPNLFITTPVRLDAIRKDLSKKCKLSHGHFFGDADSAWPPRWPRGYRNVSSLPISAFESLKITPADVVAIDKTTYTQISKSYRCSERNHKINKRKTNRRESFSGEEDAPQEIGDVHAKNWHNQDNDIPGPLQRSPSPPLPEPSAAIHSNRSRRIIRMPKQYDDFIPGDEVPDVPQPEDVMSEEGDHTSNVLISFETEPDTWGLYRVYPTCPTLFLQTSITLNTLCDSPMLQTGKNPNNTSSGIHTGPPPPIFRHSRKSVLCIQQSNSWDISIFNPTRKKRLVAQYLEDHSNPFSTRNGWKESSVYICLPKEKMKWPSEEDAPELEIKGVRHRSLTDIITEVHQ